ncbi:uncharacterized protein LOC113230337 [Hyposmocoma kahamanoa]|uniref:uncharacterized protein LOC113230337 n=1 Tax=Hyposmocoma kahamanoa TaxID=1477025 RepID=UPI000E6D9D20|nr:uncharacterized protein LOC113230337 [Hyposmocoma kahamanoa]
MCIKAVVVCAEASSFLDFVEAGRGKMQAVTLILLAVMVSVALAGGQYYVPRAYYTIDAEGHASLPVPLRRLRRSPSYNPYPPNYPGASANANANANAEAYGGGGASAIANANAHARAESSNGGWGLPIGAGYGASAPISPGITRSMSGPVLDARSISAGSSVRLDPSGQGYYDTYASAGH